MLEKNTVNAWIVVSQVFMHVLRLCMKYMHEKKTNEGITSSSGDGKNKNKKFFVFKIYFFVNI